MENLNLKPGARQVKFKRYLFKEWVNEKTGSTIFSENNPGLFGEWAIRRDRRFEDDFLTDGLFHQWATSYEEFETGPGNYTVALIEDHDGFIHQVLPQHLKFVDSVNEMREDFKKRMVMLKEINKSKK